ncbi:PAS domain S-box protein [Methanosarcina sp. MSH10X1]|uniref:PAS domain S-box protein n=1 Tax=Methanosarcina sp. MSH10X1 TaxID=2507075 RepID=UPI000FFBFCA4|nr:PAS domain S-box protein [Methanosarcina sp. MSH10X1]RXA19857.1 PAS domain S-box protein [Methanosarcina sp. MSH10X1]
MKSDAGNSGIYIIGNVPGRAHFCQFYLAKEDLMDIVIPYLRAGLENNEICIWITPWSLEAADAQEALRVDFPDIDTLLRKGQLELISCASWYVKDGVFDSQRALKDLAERIDRSLASGYNGLRLLEDICLPGKGSWSDFIDYEKKVDTAIRRSPATALCTYSLAIYSAAEVLDIVASHRFALIKREGKWEQIESTGQENLTDCGRTEQSLQETREKDRRLFEAMQEAFFIADIITDETGKPVDYLIVEANQAIEAQTGVPLEKFIGSTALGMYPGLDPFWVQTYGAVALTGKPAHFTYYADVQGRHYEVSAYQVRPGRFAAIFLNITGRKQAEEALLKSEERYRMLFTNMTDGFGFLEVIYDRDGEPYDYRYLEINPSFELNLGIKNEQLLGRTILEVFPDVSPIAMEKYREVSLSGRSAHFEIFSQIAHKYLDIYVFSPEKGKLALILRDITERKRMENELQESEEKYRNLVETASEGIWMADAEARAVYVNKSLAEMLGYTQDEIIGKFAWDFADDEDKPVVRKYFEKKRQGIDESYEFKFIRKDGSPFWTIISSKSLFDKAGKFTGSMGMLTDITGRKEAESRLEKACDNLEKLVEARTAELEKAYTSLKESEKRLAEAQKMAHIGHWEWGIATEDSYWSDELYRIFGRDRKEPYPTYQEFLNYIHPDDRDYVKSAANRAMNGEPYSIDYRIISSDGEERTVHMQSQVIFDENNTPVRIKGIVQDITDRKQTEEALAKLEKIRIKEIHHRIKNNLQVISSLLDLQAETFSQLETCKTPEVVEAFMESQNRVISMALIHEELYKGDKIDTLGFAAYLRKLTEDLFSSYKPRNKDISLKLDLEQVYLGMDTAIPLGIIINELVSNSFKHAFPDSRNDGIRINLSRTKALAAGKEIPDRNRECTEKDNFDYILEVSDNGKGIPEEINFKNTDSLGLQLVNILVEQIDGCIKLKRDHGTKFTIWFNDIEV